MAMRQVADHPDLILKKNREGGGLAGPSILAAS
jgi:hypothetical protein